MQEPRPTPARRPATWGPILLGALVVAAFCVGFFWRFFLSDDAFISFRYSRNLVEGLGLVFNPGERVEGYTNFLWVLLVAAGMAVGVRPEVSAPLLGGLSGLGVLFGIAYLGARRHGWRDPWIWLAPGALALHRSFTAWSSGGLETQLFTLLALAGVAAFLRERASADRRPLASALLLALATLTRPEGALFAGTLGLFFLADAVRAHRHGGGETGSGRAGRLGGPAPMVAWSAVYAAPVVAHLLWRRAYYGAWLPNTFHAKVNGVWWEQGADYLGYFAATYQLLWLAPLALVAVLVRRSFRETLFAALLAVYAAYVLAIGGDFLEFRFMVPVLPYLYLLLAEGVRVLVEPRFGARTAAGTAGDAPGRLRSAPEPLALLGAVAGLALLLSTALGPLADRGEPPEGFEGIAATRYYAESRAAQGRLARSLIEAGRLPPDLRVATGGVGVFPYYTGWYVVDHVGLTDARVARQELEERGRIGHEHRVTPAYLREREVAVVFLSHVLVIDDPAGLPAFYSVARDWLATYNSDARTPGERLRMVCLEPAPGYYMVFGTNLEPEALDEVLGHLPPCPSVPGGPGPGGRAVR